MDPVTLGMAQADAEKNFRLNFGGAGIVFTGDSHTNRGIVVEDDPTIAAPTVTGIQLGAASFAVQLIVRFGNMKSLYNPARSGEDTNQILARFDADVCPASPVWCMVFSATTTSAAASHSQRPSPTSTSTSTR